MSKGSKFVMNLFFILLFILVSILLYVFLAFFNLGSTESKVKIGFILNGRHDDTGWERANAEGAKVAERELDFKLVMMDNVKEDEESLIKAVNSLISQGCRAIFFTSYEYGQIMERHANEYANTVFYFNSPVSGNKNFVSYSSRNYQARYLAGMVAGEMTHSNHIGYVAALPSGEVIQGINAFALGAQRVNSGAVVDVLYTGVWSDKERERKCASVLVDKYGADVLTVHQNHNYVLETARKKCVHYIAYHVPTRDPNELTCVMVDWGRIYTEVIRDFIKGTVDREHGYWMGLEGDYVTITECSELVPDNVVDRINAERDTILNGGDVFSNIIIDNDGIIRCRPGELIPDSELINNMNWYVRGVALGNEESAR